MIMKKRPLDEPAQHAPVLCIELYALGDVFCHEQAYGVDVERGEGHPGSRRAEIVTMAQAPDFGKGRNSELVIVAPSSGLVLFHNDHHRAHRRRPHTSYTYIVFVYLA